MYGILDGRLRRALVVIEENNDGLSTVDIAECGIVGKYMPCRGGGYKQ